MDHFTTPSVVSEMVPLQPLHKFSLGLPSEGAIRAAECP